MTQNKLLLSAGALIVIVAGIALYITPSMSSTEGTLVKTDNVSTASTTAKPAGKLMSIDSYVTQNISALSPVKEQLGGTFQVTSLTAQNGEGTVSYEDGHNAYVADFTYQDSGEAGGYKVNTFIVRDTPSAKK